MLDILSWDKNGYLYKLKIVQSTSTSLKLSNNARAEFQPNKKKALLKNPWHQLVQNGVTNAISKLKKL